MKSRGMERIEGQAKISLRVSVYLWRHEERRQELLALLCEYRDTLDEVAFFTSFTHPPVPLKELERRAEILTEVIPQFKDLGLRAGINHLSLLGHLEENLDQSLDEPWQRMMDIDGNLCLGSYCPSDPGMQGYITASCVALAKAKPDFIWIDDDVRLEGHGPIQHACFCDVCLGRFSERTRRCWTRESLKTAFSGGELDDRLTLRKQWLQHNRGLISGVLEKARSAVDTVSPDLPLGLMTGELFYSGYAYSDWAEALSGEKGVEVMWRPGGGFYTDAAPCGLLDKAHSIGRQVAQLPANVVDIQSEIENFPYQPLKKSATTVAVEVAAYIAAGCTGAALNIAGITTDPFPEYAPYFQRVREYRSFYDKAVAAFGRSSCEGITLAFSRDLYAALNPRDKWFSGPGGIGAGILNELSETGLPIAYSSEGAAVTVLSGEGSCLTYSKDDLLQILSGGVLADAPALQALNDRGLSGFTGFEVCDFRNDDTVEVLTDDPINGEFAGRQRDCRQSFKSWCETAYGLRPSTPNSRALSEGRDFADRKLSPMSGVYENSLGGRFAVCGYFPWRYVQSLAKATQLKALCRWLSRDSLPAYVASYHKIALWCRRDGAGSPALMLLNASLDAAEDVVLSIRTEAHRLTVVRTDGGSSIISGVQTDGGYSTFAIPRLNPWEVVLVTVS